MKFITRFDWKSTDQRDKSAELQWLKGEKSSYCHVYDIKTVYFTALPSNFYTVIDISGMRNVLIFTKTLGVCLPSHGALASFSSGLTFAGDRVSNSLSQVFIYYFLFQSRSIFSNFPPSTPTLEEKKIQLLHLPSMAALCVSLQLNYKNIGAVFCKDYSL